MTSVNFHWHFLKENGHGKTIVSDFILQELISHQCWIIQVKGLNSALRKSVALKWVKSVEALGHIVDHHARVPEISVSCNHGQKVFVRERHTELAAHVKSDRVRRVILSCLVFFHVLDLLE